MRITVAIERDIPALVALIDSAYRGDSARQGWTFESDLFTGNKRTDEVTVGELMKTQGAIFLKYLNERNEIEGCVFLRNEGTKIYLGMLSVSPGSQAKGLGKKLLAAAEDHSQQQRCTSIYMTVISARKELIAWYERRGYKETGHRVPFPVEERFSLPRQPLDMVVMEKSLPQN